MTNLKKPIKRISYGKIREAGKNRKIVVILRPPNILGFRAKGCRKEYQLTTEGCYTMAVKADIAARKRKKKKQKSKK